MLQIMLSLNKPRIHAPHIAGLRPDIQNSVLYYAECQALPAWCVQNSETFDYRSRNSCFTFIYVGAKRL